MARNVTAVYRSHATADLVRRELEQLGISRGYIHVLPDDARSSMSSAAGSASGMGVTTGTAAPAAATGPAGTTAAGSEGAHEGVEDSALMSAIDDLHLPDEDTRTYKHCLRKGDHVVSVEADDDQIGRVQEIMRRPEDEAYNLDTRNEEFRAAEDFPRREGYAADETRLGRRDPATVDPYTRSYERGARLDERTKR